MASMFMVWLSRVCEAISRRRLICVRNAARDQGSRQPGSGRVTPAPFSINQHRETLVKREARRGGVGLLFLEGRSHAGYPSGTELTTACAPMVPPAPGRFWITTACPSTSRSLFATGPPDDVGGRGGREWHVRLNGLGRIPLPRVHAGHAAQRNRNAARY